MLQKIGEAMRASDSHQSKTMASLLDTNSIELEQSCLHRIRNHRYTIEQVVALYQKQKAQLEQQAEKITQLSQQLQELQAEHSYKEAYEELKDQYELLYEKYNESICQQKEMEKDHEKKVQQFVRQIQLAKATQKQLKDQIVLLQVHWEQIAKDKDEEYARLERQLAEKEQNFVQKLDKLSRKYRHLKNESVQKEDQFKSCQKELRSKSKAKEKELEKIKKALSKTQNQCSQYRLLSSSKQNQMELQREQMKENIQNLNLIVGSLRKQVTQKIIEIENLRQSLKRCQQRNKALQETLQNLSIDSKFRKDRQQVSVQKYDRQLSKRKKLQEQISRLKRENAKHVQDYNVLQIELRRWKGVAQKRQESNRRRKILSSSNFH